MLGIRDVARAALFGATLVSGTASGIECDGWVKSSAVTAPLDTAPAGDSARFLAAVDDSARTLVCVKQKLDAPQAARVHAAFGARAWLVGDDVLATEAFRAARATHPEATLPAGSEDPGVLALWEAATPAPASAETPEGQTSPADMATLLAVLDANGSFLFDGHLGRRPTDRATLVQVLDESGAVKHTAWLLPGAPLPGLDSPPVEPAASAPPVDRRLGAPSADLLADAEPDPTLPEGFELPSAPPTEKRARPWGLVTMGTGAATLAAGSVMLGVNHRNTMSAWEAAGQATTWPDFLEAQDAYDAGVAAVPTWRALAGAGLGLVGVGAVVQVAGARVTPTWVHGPGVAITLGGRP